MDSLGIFSLTPVAIALLISIVFRRVVLGLFLGSLSAALLINSFNPFTGLAFFFTDMVAKVIADKGHFSIIAFTLMIGALTGILIRSGATQAFVYSISSIIKGRRSAQILTSLSGLLIFFDDYSNCLIVGSSMRSVADKHGLSREKLAYIVDSTSAPIASIALISTWIAFQVSLIGDALIKANLDYDAYGFFLASIPYNFYALFAIIVVFVVSSTGRDFGPMLEAEKKAWVKKLKTEQVTKPPTQILSRRKLTLFYLPVISLILVAFSVLYITGKSATASESAPLFEIFGNADSYMAMLVSASVALFLAIFIILQGNLLQPHELASGLGFGMKELFSALSILLLAWTLGEGLSHLNVSDYLVKILSGNVSPALMPTLVFAIAAFVSFATGTSFGTMALLVPTALPVIFLTSTDHTLYLATAASILGGSVFGDHCSPLSDTTILSSTGSKCDILAHVNTQIPYALLAAFFAIAFGTIPVGFGLSSFWALPTGAFAIYAVFRVFGKVSHSDEIEQNHVPDIVHNA